MYYMWCHLLTDLIESAVAEAEVKSGAVSIAAAAVILDEAVELMNVYSLRPVPPCTFCQY